MGKAVRQHIERQPDLRALDAQRLHARLAGGRFVVADDHRHLRAARVGPAHLGLEAPAAAVLHDREAVVAQPLGDGEREPVGGLALVHEVDVLRLGRHGPARLLQQRDQALDPHREADRRGRLAADLVEQPVVASAAAHRPLRAEAVGHPLEHGEVVVVEPAHQVVVDGEREAGVLQDGLQAVEVLQRRLAKVVEELRRVLDDRPHRGILAVEHAQRVGDQPAARIGVEVGFVPLEMRHQRVAMRAPLVERAERVDLQPHALEAEVVPEPRAHQDELGVHVRPGVAERLGADLVELPVSTLLRPFVPEHGAHVLEPLRPGVEQRVLDAPRAPSRRSPPAAA